MEKMLCLFTALAILAMLNLTVSAGQTGSHSGRKVMLLSSAVAQGDVLAEAAKDDVIVIRYETKTTTMDDLVAMVRERLAGEAAISIAFVNHDYGENKFYLTKSETVSLGSSLSSEEQQTFWKEMGALTHPNGRIDLLACNLAKGDQGGMLISTLEKLSERNVAASSNRTGNQDESTDWVLETDSIDVSQCYFRNSGLGVFSGQLVASEQKITYDDSSFGVLKESFGSSVSIFGDTALVGADGYVLQRPLLGTTLENVRTGAVYVFVRDGDGIWTQDEILTPSDGLDDDSFGSSVSLYGNTALIGAPGVDRLNDEVGAAYVFVRDGGTWNQKAKLTDSSLSEYASFGDSVSLYGDTALIGASGHLDCQGRAFVFVRQADGEWPEEGELLRPVDLVDEAFFGFSVSLFEDTALIGACGYFDGDETGSAYVFVRDDSGEWSEEWKLMAKDGEEGYRFGYMVSLCGDTALVGEPRRDTEKGGSAGSAHIFVRDDSGEWVEEAELTAEDGIAGDEFGSSVRVFGDTVLVGAAGNSGSAYLFARNGSTWSRQAKLTPKDGEAGDQFGVSLDISDNSILVGAPGDRYDLLAGAAYLFNLPGVESTEFSAVTSNSALCGGVILEGLAEVMERGVFLSTSNSPAHTGTKVPYYNPGPDPAPNAFTVQVKYLDADTTYYFCAYAISSRGTYWGEEISFKTNETRTATARAVENGHVRIGEFGVAASTVTKTVDQGDPWIKFYAVPALGYHFLKWTQVGKEDSTDNPLTLAVTEDVTVTAEFAVDPIPEIEIADRVGEDGLVIAPTDNEPSLEDHTDFGNVNLYAGPDSWYFVIGNPGTGNLRITDVTVEAADGIDRSPGFTVINKRTPFVIIPGSEVMLKVSFDPTTTGLRKAIIKVHSNDPDTPVYPFAVQGVGVAQNIEVTGNPDFGAKDVVGGTALREFTILNSGDDMLSFAVLPITITGDHAEEFKFDPLESTELNPNGGSVVLSVHFDPQGLGTRIANLSIFSDDLDDNPIIIPLTGLGTNQSPVAAAVSVPEVPTTSDVIRLSASPSHDPDNYPNDQLTYSWTYVSGPVEEITLNDTSGDGMETTWSTSQNGVYVFELAVNDGANSDTVPITVIVGDLLYLSVPKEMIEGGEEAHCQLSIQRTLQSDLHITIHVSDRSELTAPETVMIPAGSQSVDFLIQAIDDEEDDDTQVVTLSATADLWISSGEEISIQDDEEPRVEASGNGIVIENNSTETRLENETDYGPSLVTPALIDHTFTLHNRGKLDLILTGDPYITISDGAIEDFQVMRQPSSGTIRPGEKLDFIIRFSPREAGGTRTATVSIATNDSVTPVYRFNVKGETLIIYNPGGAVDGGGCGCLIASGERDFHSVFYVLFIVVIFFRLRPSAKRFR